MYENNFTDGDEGEYLFSPEFHGNLHNSLPCEWCDSDTEIIYLYDVDGYRLCSTCKDEYLDDAPDATVQSFDPEWD